MKGKACVALLCLALASCVHTQLTENTLEAASTVETLRADQFFDNLSDAIDVEDRVPSLVVVNTGQASTTAGLSLSAQLPAMNLSKNTRTLTPTANGSWTDFWSLSPVSDPQDLRNLRALYSLLYRDDNKVAKIIYETMEVYGVQDAPEAQQGCGISIGASKDPNTARIIDATKALPAYLVAMQSFPTVEDGNTTPPAAPTGNGTSNAASGSKKAKNTSDTGTSDHAAAASSTKATSAKKAKATTPATATTAKATTESGETKNCFNNNTIQISISASLAKSYGLLYPNAQQVTGDFRNGTSPSCREYQLDHLRLNGQLDPKRLFARWLFWKNPDQSWGPEAPSAKTLKTLQPYPGTFGVSNRQFWLADTACVSDFIILAIDSTANSHAAAQASPKGSNVPTGQ